MTAPVIPVVERDEVIGQGEVQPREGVSFVRVWLSSLVYLVAPRRNGRVWLQATWLQGLWACLIHFVLGWIWLVALAYTVEVWSADQVYHFEPRTIDRYVYNPDAFAAAWDRLGQDVVEQYQQMALMDKVGAVAGIVVSLAACFGLPFFILLPLGARPGLNKPCVKHVARTVLLGSGGGHVLAIAMLAMFWWRIWFPGDHQLAAFYRLISPMLLMLTALATWAWVALGRIVRLDYRTEADMPKPHDPWCDHCGYNLIAAEMSGRCPECGREVRLSLGEDQRLPTAWERWPSLKNRPAIVHQVIELVRRPRRLFYSMPTLTGQPAAHRWLVGSLILVAIAALPIVPVMALVRNAEWSMDLVTGSMATGLVWAVLSCMMVGIETAGLATFSRMKGHGIPLATASKVTCYASTLLVVWVFFGGLQLVGFVMLGDHFVMRTIPLGITRLQQMILAAALAVPHMAGLLWFELTVYRGIRAVQFANK